MKSQGVHELSSFVFFCVHKKIFIGSGRTFASQRLTKIPWLPEGCPSGSAQLN